MNLNFIMVTTLTKRFAWEVVVQLHNFRERGISHLTHLLVFKPYSMLEKQRDELWDVIDKNFPEVNIWYYNDTTNFERVYNGFGYIPLIRPFLLAKYFEQHPEFSKEAWFYTDTDVLFTESINFHEYLKDDVCYMSEAGGYTDHDYFDSKYRLDANKQPEFMKPEKYQEGRKRDFLNEFAGFAGIDRQTIIKNKSRQGAAQYLLKNVDADYWRDVLTNCMEIKTHMDTVNREFMQSADKGFQAWCADIHAVVWNLWKRNMKTECPKEFDFSWATDKIDVLNKRKIFHNAGVTSEDCIRETVKDANGSAILTQAPAFYKGHYRYVSEETSPFTNPEWLLSIINHPITSQYATAYYAMQLLSCKDIYNL